MHFVLLPGEMDKKGKCHVLKKRISQLYLAGLLLQSMTMIIVLTTKRKLRNVTVVIVRWWAEVNRSAVELRGLNSRRYCRLRYAYIAFPPSLSFNNQH